MLKLFKKKTPVYIDLETYDYSSFARDMTEEELLTVNGGKEIANSNAAVAEGEVGDTLRRNDGTVVTITQADIDWAKEQVSSPSTTSTTTTTETSSSTSSTPSTSTPQSSVVKRDSTPERESSTVLENIARYKALAGNNQIKPTTVGGKKSSGTAVTGQAAIGNSAGEGNLTDRGYPSSRDANPGNYKPKQEAAPTVDKNSTDTGNLSDRGYPSSRDPNPGIYTPKNDNSSNERKSVIVEPVINEWKMSGGFKKIYEGTPVNDGKPYYHNGKDFIIIDSEGDNVTRGRPVYSTIEGTVVGSGYEDSIEGADPDNKGNWVRIDLGDGWMRDYYHLSYTNMKVGDEVSVGTYIGSAGNTGASTGPHLHVDEFSYKKPSDYDENQNAYLAKSYDGGISYVYFRNPGDHR